MNERQSTPLSEFEDLYTRNSDPWNYSWPAAIRHAFAARFYEQRKYWKTWRIIPRRRYRTALEIGCSIGVFTQRLAARCEELVAIDYSPTALARARERCRRQPRVRFLEAKVPEQFPPGTYELIVFSEVAYYLSREDFLATAQRIVAQLAEGGFLVMVHYRHHRDYPLSGDFAHDWFLNEAGPALVHLQDWRRPSAYRLDLFQKIDGGMK